MDSFENWLPLFLKTNHSIAHEPLDIGFEYSKRFGRAEHRRTICQKTWNKISVLAETTQGIHKDDLLFTLDQEPLKKICFTRTNKILSNLN